MPTLDDSPILETLTPVEFEADVAGTATSIATQDLILIYDVSEQKIKTCCLRLITEQTGMIYKG